MKNLCHSGRFGGWRENNDKTHTKNERIIEWPKKENNKYLGEKKKMPPMIDTITLPCKEVVLFMSLHILFLSLAQPAIFARRCMLKGERELEKRLSLYSSATPKWDEGEEMSNNSLSLSITHFLLQIGGHIYYFVKRVKKLRGLGEWSGSEYVYVFSIPGIDCDSFFLSLSPMLIRILPWTMINISCLQMKYNWVMLGYYKFYYINLTN